MFKKTSPLVITLLFMVSLSAQIKSDLTCSTNKQCNEYYITDTISYTNNKNFKPAYSRIAINQLAINFSKLFYEKYPNQNITVPIRLVFQFTISESGEIQATEITRSLFSNDINMQLVGIGNEVTANSWEPAIYQGKKIVSQVTLPLTIYPKK